MDHLTHLHALQLRASHERLRLAASRNEGERQMRGVWLAQIEREIDAEYRFLGLTQAPDDIDDMTTDELLAALAA